MSIGEGVAYHSILNRCEEKNIKVFGPVIRKQGNSLEKDITQGALLVSARKGRPRIS